MEFISIKKLYPHPQNPRKEIREIEELTESIKSKGIYQNLTVIEGGAGVPKGEKGYTVIIGHRRLEAAKRAGLTEVPCNIVTMDEKEQISTMLLENMQRNDLTLSEQAEGFQMMLDFGETISSISQKTGLSTTTVRHRIKLTELDSAKLKEAESKQINITDFFELEKIKDKEERNKLLDSIGTSSFQWELNSALRTQEQKEAEIKLLSYLSSVAEEKPESLSFEKSKIFYYSNGFENVKKEIEEYIGEEKAYYRSLNYYVSIYLAKDISKTTDEEKKKEKEAEAQKKEERKEKLKELNSQMKEMREKFVREYNSSGTEKIGVLIPEIIKEASEYSYMPREKMQAINSMLNISAESEYEAICSEVKTEECRSLLISKPVKALLAVIVSHYTTESVVNWNGSYNEKHKLDALYDILTEMGYQISSFERELLNGTHPLFRE